VIKITPKKEEPNREPRPERIALKKHEAAFAIGVSDETLNKWVKEGKIPVCKTDGCVLFPVEILKSFVMDNAKTRSNT
jgi:predicted site-specific integrase-resolvase